MRFLLFLGIVLSNAPKAIFAALINNRISPFLRLDRVRERADFRVSHTIVLFRCLATDCVSLQQWPWLGFLLPLRSVFKTLYNQRTTRGETASPGDPFRHSFVYRCFVVDGERPQR